MILVTGGNGIVGSRLALAILKLPRTEKVRVLGLTRAESDSLLIQSGVEVHYGDVTRSEELQHAMQGVDTVFHLAAILSSPENPARYRAVNVGGTKTVLKAAKQNGVRRFVFISSISVLYPRRNAYSASKAEAEECVRQSGIPWIIARPCLVLGGLEHKAFESAVLKWPILLLPRGGKALKRPIRTGDLAEALARLASNDGVTGKTIVLGGKQIVSLRGMVESILHAHNLRKQIWPVPEICLRVAATVSEIASRIFRCKVSWLTHQSVDGLVYDAVPETDIV